MNFCTGLLSQNGRRRGKGKERGKGKGKRKGKGKGKGKGKAESIRALQMLRQQQDSPASRTAHSRSGQKTVSVFC